MSHANLVRFILVALFLSGTWMVYHGVNEIMLGRASLSWPAVQGVVKEVVLGKDDRALYSYEFEGGHYENDTQGFGLLRGEGSYPRKGDHVSIYVNPTSPQQATLKTGFGGGVWLFLVLGGLFVIFSIVLTFLMLWYALNDWRNTHA